jgi:hypothetical protein
MDQLEMSYQDVVLESGRLAMRNDNPAMRIGKSTLGNIISGSIRQPSGAKLDSLRIILHLSRVDMDVALGLQPDRRLAEQLEMRNARTHVVSYDAVTRQRLVRVPIMRTESDLRETQMLEAVVQEWANVDVEYLGAYYPPHLIYAVVGERDSFASPVAPPGTRLLVNTFLTAFTRGENGSFHLRPLFYVLTSNGFTCSYLENGEGEKIVLVPHPLSGHIRRELPLANVQIIGQVVGLLFP